MLRLTTLLAAGLLIMLVIAGCAGKKEVSLDKEAKADDKTAKKDIETKDPAKTDAGPKDVAKPDDKSKGTTKTDKSKPVGNEKPKHIPPPPLKPTGDVAKLKSVEFGEEFKKDPDVTPKKYHNKFVELTGRVTGMSVTAQGEAIVSLEGARDADDSVLCYTRDKKPWFSVLPGQTVTIRGIGPKDAIVPSLVECDILGDAKGPRTPTMTADELVGWYMKDAEALKKAYSTEKAGVMKPLIIEGVVAKVEVDKDSDIPILTLKTKKPTPVIYLRCTVGRDQKRGAKFKEGDAVRAMGTFSTGFAGKQSVGISDVLILEPAP